VDLNDKLFSSGFMGRLQEKNEKSGFLCPDFG
jgi:hypothetical protein